MSNQRVALSSTRGQGKFLAPVFLLLFISFAFMPGGCGQSHEKYYSNPDVYLVRQLAAKRIVMLADFYHSAPLPFETLTSFLDEWEKEVASGKSSSTKVVLVLEDDKQIVDNLRTFISTGDWKPLVHFWLPYNTMEWLEFCSDLRALCMRIDSVNARRAPGRRIKFGILGGEEYDIFDHPALLRLSKEEGAKEFVSLRDSMSASNIIDYLDSCRDTKAIVFYGLAHLIGKYVHKNSAFLPESETGGYYLAHYLKRRFGGDSVLTVAQITSGRVNKKCWLYPVAARSDVFVPSKELRSKDIDFFGFRPDYFDGFITRRERLIIGHSLGSILSRTVVEADIRRLSFLRGYLPGGLAQRYYNEALESLRFTTGEGFKDPHEWEVWFSKTQYDGFRRISSKSFANQVFNEFYQSAPEEDLRKHLYDLGFPEEILNPDAMQSQDYWKHVLWPQMMKRMKIYESIGLLWVGTPDEKKEAEDYLTKTLGWPLKKPQDYLKSDRKNFFHADY